jgi:hypothetical protein
MMGNLSIISKQKSQSRYTIRSKSGTADNAFQMSLITSLLGRSEIFQGRPMRSHAIYISRDMIRLLPPRSLLTTSVSSCVVTRKLIGKYLNVSSHESRHQPARGIDSFIKYQTGLSHVCLCRTAFTHDYVLRVNFLGSNVEKSL